MPLNRPLPVYSRESNYICVSVTHWGTKSVKLFTGWNRSCNPWKQIIHEHMNYIPVFSFTKHYSNRVEQSPPASRKRAPPVTAMRVLVDGLLSPTLVHFMPTTLTMMPINPSSTDTTIRARHVWMWTRQRNRKRKEGQRVAQNGKWQWYSRRYERRGNAKKI